MKTLLLILWMSSGYGMTYSQTEAPDMSLEECNGIAEELIIDTEDMVLMGRLPPDVDFGVVCVEVTD